MKIRRLPMPDIVSLARMVLVEVEDGLKAGTYALDGEGRVWKLEETVTGLFQELLMDAPIRRESRGKNG